MKTKEKVSEVFKVINDDDKPKVNGYKNLKKSFKFYKKYMGLFITIVVLSLIGSGISMLTPIFEGNLISEFTNLNFKWVLIYGGAVLGVAILLNVVYSIWYRFLIVLNQKVKVDIKKELIYSLTELETKNYDKTNSGVFISRVNSDANELSTFYNSVVDCLADVISNLGFLVYIAILNIWVALFVVIEIIVFYFIENKRIRLWFRNRKRWKEADEKVVGTYSELIRGVRDVKVLNLKEAAIATAAKRQDEAILLSKKIDVQNDAWRRVRRVADAIFDFLFIGLCVLLIFNNLLLPATFFIVYLYIGRVKNLINYIINIKQDFTDGELAASRIFEVLDGSKFPKEKFGNTTLNNVVGQIEFCNVNFGYNANETLFKDLNFKILPNQTVGIVGKSGQGKSTILHLIDKLYLLNDGKILLDNVDITKLTENSLRDNVSVVVQNPYIFNTTIMENLKLVRPDATDEEIFNACKRAQIHDFIYELPNKYESLVGENGVVLSGGQRQRLAIARALLKNSKVILFDEATSALDNESQGKIKLVTHELSRDHTIIIVAHRLSTVVDCDNILVLDHNNIVAQGKHKDLMKSCKVYKELYEIEEA